MKSLIVFVLLLIPSVVFASQTIGGIIDTATGLVLLAVPVAVAAALLFFLWNMFQLMTSLDDAEKKKQARPRMIWGIIALFVILSLGALVAVLDQTFFGSGSSLQQAPSSIGGGNPGGGVFVPPDTGDDNEIDPFQPNDSGCTFFEQVSGNCPDSILI